MKTLKVLAALMTLSAVLTGCGASDVTEQSYEDAMKERGQKAANLQKKEGTAPTSDSSTAISQDPQAGATKSSTGDAPTGGVKDGD